MTGSLDTTFSTEGKTAVMENGCVAAFHSFGESVLPVEKTPRFEFFVVFIAVDVKGLGDVLVGLGRGGDHQLLSRLNVV